MAGKEGTHVVVRYVARGGDKTAIAVKDFGKDALKASKGRVSKVDKGGRTVAIKTEETYRVSKHAAVDTEHGVVDGDQYTAKEGDKVVFHTAKSPAIKWFIL